MASFLKAKTKRSQNHIKGQQLSEKTVSLRFFVIVVSILQERILSLA